MASRVYVHEFDAVCNSILYPFKQRLFAETGKVEFDIFSCESTEALIGQWPQFAECVVGVMPNDLIHGEFRGDNVDQVKSHQISQAPKHQVPWGCADPDCNARIEKDID